MSPHPDEPQARKPTGSRVALGVVVRPHGVRGELRVHLFNDESNVFFEQEALFLGEDAKEATVVAASRRTPKGGLLRLQGVEGREAADALRGVELYVDRAALPEPDEDEIYLADLEGLEVFDPEGHRLGEVEGFLSYPSVDCLRVRVAEGVREVPLVEPWIVEIDLEAARIVVASIEELELERG